MQLPGMVGLIIATLAPYLVEILSAELLIYQIDLDKL